MGLLFKRFGTRVFYSQAVRSGRGRRVQQCAYFPARMIRTNRPGIPAAQCI